jgi:hypothetical protein
MSLGLLSRAEGLDLPRFVHLYIGDFLWALMVYWGICLVAFRWSFTRQVLAALVFAYCIEFSQFYQADWINELRHTRLGGLILGFGFKWSDLVAYTLGIFFGATVNRVFLVGYLNEPKQS